MKNYYSLLNNQLTNNLYLHFRIKFPIFLLSLSLPIIPRQIGRYFGINKRYKETERRYVWQKEAGKQIVKKISQPSSCGSVGTVHSLRQQQPTTTPPPKKAKSCENRVPSLEKESHPLDHPPRRPPKDIHNSRVDRKSTRTKFDRYLILPARDKVR